MASRQAVRGAISPLRRELATTSQASASTSNSASFRPPPPPPPPTSPEVFDIPTPSPDRVYTERKTFLYKYYTHLLTNSQLVLLFNHSNLTTSDANKIRRAINAIPVPPSPFDPNSSPSSSSTSSAPPEKATLTITRTGILSAYSKTVSSAISLKPHLSGPTALLTTPSLSPTYLSKLLSALTKTLKSIQKSDASGPNPSSKTPENGKQASMTLVAGILEGGRLLTPDKVGEVGKLPELDILRAQVVGMLEGQGRSLVGVLGQAAGGGLVRTLQGLEKGLKDGQETSKAS